MKERWLSDRKGVLLLAILATLLWGSAYPAVKTGYALFHISSTDTFTQILFAGVRFTFAGMMTIVVGSILQRKWLKPERSRILPLCGLALTLTFLQYIFYYIGLANTFGIKGAILNSMGTFTAVILSHFLYRNDRLTSRKVTGCLIGFIGVIAIHLGGELGGFSFRGEGFMLIASICFGLGSVISKRVSQGVNPMMVTGYQLSIGGLGLILTGLIGGGRFTELNGACLAILLYLSFLSAAAFSLWTLLFKHNPASRVAVYSLLIPVFGTLMSGLFLHEPLFSIQNVCSLVLVCTGIGIVNTER